MNSFSDDWLALREPADSAARPLDISRLLRARKPPAEHWRVLDLGSGNGSNLRFLLPALGHGQDWLLVDHDQKLLDAGAHRLAAWACEHGADSRQLSDGIEVRSACFSAALRWKRLDISVDIGQAVATRNLVTCAALLDLVSEPWLHELTQACAEHNSLVLFALSYNGHMSWTPALPDDTWIRDRFNTHQQGDKGFGPALGPRAVQTALRYLQAADYAVHHAVSDWRLTADSDPLARELIHGIANAVTELEPDASQRIVAWRDARIKSLDQPSALMRVGHGDLFGAPGTSLSAD